MSNQMKIAVAWFRKEDWAELKQLCPPDDLQDTYEEWLANAQQGIKAAGFSEHDVQKVILTPDDLREWKAANDGEINSSVRARLAAEAAHRRKDTTH
jgi:hypothetical protein